MVIHLRAEEKYDHAMIMLFFFLSVNSARITPIALSPFAAHIGATNEATMRCSNRSRATGWWRKKYVLIASETHEHHHWILDWKSTVSTRAYDGSSSDMAFEFVSTAMKAVSARSAGHQKYSGDLQQASFPPDMAFG